MDLVAVDAAREAVQHAWPLSQRAHDPVADGNHQRRGRYARTVAPVELAPVRVNAISPGTIDTGTWDGLGADGKASLSRGLTESNPARRDASGPLDVTTSSANHNLIYG